MLAFKDLSGTAESTVQDDATILPSDSPSSAKSTDDSPMTPQQLLIQGIGESVSISSLSGIAIIAVIVLVVLYMSKRRRMSAGIDEKHGP